MARFYEANASLSGKFSREVAMDSSGGRSDLPITDPPASSRRTGHNCLLAI